MNNQHKPDTELKMTKGKTDGLLRAAKSWIIYLTAIDPDGHCEEHPMFNVYKLEGREYEDLVKFYKELRDNNGNNKVRTIE